MTSTSERSCVGPKRHSKSKESEARGGRERKGGKGGGGRERKGRRERREGGETASKHGVYFPIPVFILMRQAARTSHQQE